MSASVSAELLAIAATQPWVLKRAAATRPAATRTARRRTSPQTGFVTSTVALASGKSPALCGARKWPRMISLNTAPGVVAKQQPPCKN